MRLLPQCFALCTFKLPPIILAVLSMGISTTSADSFQSPTGALGFLSPTNGGSVRAVGKSFNAEIRGQPTGDKSHCIGISLRICGQGLQPPCGKSLVSAAEFLPTSFLSEDNNSLVTGPFDKSHTSLSVPISSDVAGTFATLQLLDVAGDALNSIEEIAIAFV